jgi:choline-sulfatase
MNQQNLGWGGTRRRFVQTGCNVAAATLLPAFKSLGGQGATAKNLLIIMSDQHKRNCLGVAGDPVARTPNLDSLARTSVRFTDAYCTNPVCTPSRASILTGLYTHKHESWNNTTPLPPKHKTIAHHFSRAGYLTGLIGKMHFVDGQTHGFDYKLDFNDWFQFLGPKTKLYADELSRANSGAGMPEIDDLWRDYGDPWRGVRTLDEREGPVAVGGVSKIPEQDHFESFVARESVRFLKRFGGQQPFLLVCSFLKPHDPFMPAARFANMFRPEDMRLPDTWGKVNLSQVPAEIRSQIRRNAPTPELRNPDEARKRMAFYYANLAQMDDCAGVVLRALRDLGLEQNTIVAYTSDHGDMLGEHGLWQKFEFYEASCGVPLTVRVPGLPAGVCGMPLSQVNLLPTFAELCNVPVSSSIEGESFLEQIQQPSLIRPRPVFAEYNLRRPQAKYMIRDGDRKYTFWNHDMPELYNLRRDPKEMTNLALQPEYRQHVAALKEKLFAWYRPPEI